MRYQLKALELISKVIGRPIEIDKLKSQGLMQLLAKKAIGKPINFSQSTLEVEVLCRQEQQFVAPAIFIYHHLSRITATGPYSTLGSELSLLFTQEITHVPTLLYKLENVKINRGGLWTEDRSYWSRTVCKNNSLSSVELDAAILVDQDYTTTFFGHWLMDFVPATLVGKSDRPSLALNRPNHDHAKEYEELFGLDVIYANSGFVKELFFLHDLTQNSYKVSRYVYLKNQLQIKLNPENIKYEGVYIVRGSAGAKRILENEQALIDHLAKRGFDIIDPLKMRPEMIVRKLWNAPLVIGVEGSAITHALCTAANCAGYLLLMPPDRFLIILKGILDALNNPFGFYVCKPSVESDSFYVDSMSDIDRLIDLLKLESANRLQN